MDVLLVEAGPIGIELAINFKQLGINYLHVEKGRVAETICEFPLGVQFYSSNERICLADVPRELLACKEASFVLRQRVP